MSIEGKQQEKKERERGKPGFCMLAFSKFTSSFSKFVFMILRRPIFAVFLIGLPSHLYRNLFFFSAFLSFSFIFFFFSFPLALLLVLCYLFHLFLLLFLPIFLVHIDTVSSLFKLLIFFFSPSFFYFYYFFFFILIFLFSP